MRGFLGSEIDLSDFAIYTLEITDAPAEIKDAPADGCVLRGLCFLVKVVVLLLQLSAEP